MAIAVFQCPHCVADGMTFDLAGEFLIRGEAPMAVTVDDRSLWNTFFVCRRCKEGVVLKAIGPRGYGNRYPSTYTEELMSAGFEQIAMFPRRAEPAAPEHVPAPIARNFVEATDNLRRRNYTSAGMMFRKVLDRATRELAPEGDAEALAKKSLYDRINALTDARELTPAMRDWAHVIRLEGNEAAHDDDTDAVTAAQLQAFTELFLIYAFTLPERVREHTSKGDANGT